MRSHLSAAMRRTSCTIYSFTFVDSRSERENHKNGDQDRGLAKDFTRKRNVMAAIFMRLVPPAHAYPSRPLCIQKPRTKPV